ncbi:hypothetical protein Fleli_2479 [Bernardetia litoralis DSM 6794]|uniref:Lipoprotein n=1 Tax=Bernardetia litoralis (strain ATCC 23117 / DSM 6794 / NBRC 15988 / NCIMB 1366 / Fx l1 / Sio-4) TaxID=880071 RepID=I4ALK9_BERLS|nr:hypothetical protein [Bernardetia litoralis]AFM04844.1 hypothetical protein Fleli_2479 [Bernardetia litoralis DSM 6794]
MKKLQLLAFWMAMLSLFGCSESLCGDRFTQKDGNEIPLKQGVSLCYQNSSEEWQSAIGIYGIYRLDSVRLYDENGNICTGCSGDNQGFYFTYADKDTPQGVDMVVTHYLYLTYQDTDTMRHEFKINPSNCKKILDYGRFYYNNELIKSSQNENFIPYASFEKK